MFQVGDLVHYGTGRYCVVVAVGQLEGCGTCTSVWGHWKSSEEGAISAFECLEEEHKRPLSSGGKLGYAVADSDMVLVRSGAFCMAVTPKSFMSFVRKVDKEYSKGTQHE